MRRPLLLLPLLGVTALAVPTPEAHAAAAGASAKPSGCAAGANTTLKWHVKGTRFIRRQYLKDGKITTQRESARASSAPFPVAELGIKIRSCRTKNEKGYRVLDAYPASGYPQMQRDLNTTVSNGDDGPKLTVVPRNARYGWGLGAYPTTRTDNTLSALNVTCTVEPKSLQDQLLSGAHGLLALPIPVGKSGPQGLALEFGLTAVDALLPPTPPDTYLCAGGETVSLAWRFTTGGRARHVSRKKQMYSFTTPSAPCSANVPPSYESCQETVSTTWTYFPR